IEEPRDPELQALLKATVPGSSQAVALCRVAVRWLERSNLVTEAVLKKLQELARAGRHATRLHWASTLGRKTDRGRRDAALRVGTGEDFRPALRKLLAPIAPADFVCLRHLPALMQDARLPQANEEQLVDLIEAVLAIDAGEQLGALTDGVFRIGDSGLR